MGNIANLSTRGRSAGRPGSLLLCLICTACASGTVPERQIPGDELVLIYPGSSSGAKAAWQEPARSGLSTPRTEGALHGPTASTGCGAGETQVDGRCYWSATAAGMTYLAATTVCASQGGQVAAIPSAAVNAAALSSLESSSAAWIGLVKQPAGGFVWTSGDPLAYTNWAPNEPNNESGAEECAVMWGPGLTAYPAWQGQWNDAPCDDVRGAVICERQL